LGNYYTKQYVAGNRDVIQLLSLEEANLLHARRAARRHGWWGRVISAMQGLRVLCEQYQGRTAEWARLVAEITPDYCTSNDAPIPGREDRYSLVMEYRVHLTQNVERNLPKAAALQGKLVAWNRGQAAAVLALSTTAPLNNMQRNLIRTLSVSLEALGHILREQNSPDCAQQYQEVIRHCQRIGDTTEEAIVHFNLGHAYKDLPAIRDLDAAEAAYRHSLELENPNDALARSADLKQIGMVHHERFNESRGRGDPAETTLRHAQAAEQHYHQALRLCPPSAVADLGPMHNQLGNLYREVGQTEPAREHYERAAQYFEQVGNRYHAGQTRYNLALMYDDAAGREPARRRDLLRRAAAYAQASLRDYESYQGRAADREAKARRLIEDIARALGE
jgi:tetratricopeptide (TPR) repeat protein